MMRDYDISGLDMSDGKIIFGGSFDPVHKGHISMALAAFRELPADEIIMIPTKLTYYKKRKLTCNSDRLKMLRLAAEPYPYMSVSDMELKAPVEENYTVNTLEKLKNIYPGRELFFLIGGDSLAYLDTWYKAERLFQLAVFVAAVRGEVDIEKAADIIGHLRERFPGARIRLLDTEPVDVSSTDIRNAAAEGRSIRGMVPDRVEEYIVSKGLYRKK